MTAFEFVFSLFGLLLGLSLAEVLGGLARTLKQWRLVRPGCVGLIQAVRADVRARGRARFRRPGTSLAGYAASVQVCLGDGVTAQAAARASAAYQSRVSRTSTAS